MRDLACLCGSQKWTNHSVRQGFWAILAWIEPAFHLAKCNKRRIFYCLKYHQRILEFLLESIPKMIQIFVSKKDQLQYFSSFFENEILPVKWLSWVITLGSAGASVRYGRVGMFNDMI